MVVLVFLLNPSGVGGAGDAGGLAATTVIVAAASDALDCDVLRAPWDARGEGDRDGGVDGGA